MKILITGACGFVGTRLVAHLSRDRHHTLAAIDNLRSGAGRRERLRDHSVRFYEADIRSSESVLEVMKDFAPEVIVHLAAIHFIPECERNSELALSTNIVGTVNLLRHAPEGSRLVFASSGAVYGITSEMLNEDVSPIGPSDIYGFSKFHGEDYGRYLSRVRGLDCRIVRLFNVIGPGETSPHILPEIVAQLKAGNRILRLGNLSAKRDYIHVDDAAAGFATIALAAQTWSDPSIVVNLSGGNVASVAELLEHLRQIGAGDFRVELDPLRLRGIDRPMLRADLFKINTIFGWHPSYDIRSALQSLWSNPDLPPNLVAKYQT